MYGVCFADLVNPGLSNGLPTDGRSKADAGTNNHLGGESANPWP